MQNSLSEIPVYNVCHLLPAAAIAVMQIDGEQFVMCINAPALELWGVQEIKVSTPLAQLLTLESPRLGPETKELILNTRLGHKKVRCKCQQLEDGWLAILHDSPAVLSLAAASATLSNIESALKNTDGVFKALAGLVATLIAILTSVSIFFGGIPPTKKGPSTEVVASADSLTKLLEREAKRLKGPENNGLAYWEYDENYRIRKLRALYSPIVSERAFDAIAVRYTDEEGWGSLVERHQAEETFVIRFSDLEQDSALRLTMLRIGSREVITVPIFTDQLVGYVSVGYRTELTDNEEASQIRKMNKIAARLATFLEG